MELECLHGWNACLKAMERQKMITQPFDWQVLMSLKELKKPCGLKVLTDYHSATYYKAFKSRYYCSLDRLRKAAYVTQSLTKSGFRRWQINIKGELALIALNHAANAIFRRKQSAESIPAIAQSSQR